MASMKLRESRLAAARSHAALAFLGLHFYLAPLLLRPPSDLWSKIAYSAHLLLLVVALVSVTGSRLLGRTCIGLVVAGSVIRWVDTDTTLVGELSAGTLSMIAIAVAWTLVTAQFFDARRVQAALLSRAVCMYLLAGVFWAECYRGIEAAWPESFRGPGPAVEARDLHYFSYVTMSTLGYGDLAPVREVARSAAVTQAMFGQMFVAIVIGRLVGLQVSRGDRVPSPSAGHAAGAVNQPGPSEISHE